MVKCLLEEKEINHTVIIFTGEQGLGKTTWLLNLVPEPLRKYRFSGTISVSNKDTLVHMAECMLINLDELETLNKSEIGELKELITKGTIRQRLPYARNNSSLIRRSTFVGSVNNGQFLTDLTGNRRFLCFEALSINYLHKIDLQKVFAQCLFLIRNDYKHWFDLEEIHQLDEHNQQFTVTQFEEELLLKYFKIPEEGDEILYKNATDILLYISETTKISITNSSKLHIGKLLHKYRFKKGTRNNRKIYEVALNEV